MKLDVNKPFTPQENMIIKSSVNFNSVQQSLKTNINNYGNNINYGGYSHM